MSRKMSFPYITKSLIRSEVPLLLVFDEKGLPLEALLSSQNG
jgi:hypothetical protein